MKGIYWLLILLTGCQTTAPVIIPVNKSPSTVVAKAPRKPQEAAKYRLLGLDYQKQKRLSEAIKAMQKSVDLDPENAIGKVNLGWALHLASRDIEARKVLEQVTQEHRDNVFGFNALGIVYLVMGDLSKAVETHQKAAKLKKDNEIAYYNLSLAYHRLGRYEQAIIEGKKATKLEPNNPHPLVALAVIFWDQGNLKHSKEYYRQAIVLDSSYRDLSYLEHLVKAGFSNGQIQTVKKILNYSL